jgi:hypothetical protein
LPSRKRSCCAATTLLSRASWRRSSPSWPPSRPTWYSRGGRPGEVRAGRPQGGYTAFRRPTRYSRGGRPGAAPMEQGRGGLSGWLTKQRAEAAVDRPIVSRRLPICGSRHDQGGKVVKGVHCDHKNKVFLEVVAAAPSASHLTAGPLRAAPLRAHTGLVSSRHWPITGKYASQARKYRASTGQPNRAGKDARLTLEIPTASKNSVMFPSSNFHPDPTPPSPAPSSHAAARTATVSGRSY